MYICIYYDVIIHVYTVYTYVYIMMYLYMYILYVLYVNIMMYLYMYILYVYIYIMLLLCADLFTALHVLGFCLPSTSSSVSLVAWGMWATDT